MKTGHCRFGGACRFNHPLQYAVQLNRLGLPRRPNQPPCQFYIKTGTCKFGASCKWDHPD
ncbi:Serine threonine- kinase endoribonuclease IRE1 [Chlorella sorokiniana]|uniref:Serine threonine-kinase endoribonuclease IRE1 n=1 Tax=Chlorella sorokiniana TaxID=3076 RepID=A0A2P6TDJ0_CHLSO|nr:Serine threonine- kinase endoribonuclease IRE1 [Chlorella sorokiniana]|eukprot:PRW20697.1 Serine threonine- kinase endoribonuclease IRE1 [Chlorella sorokiniana]